jgi:hypothetical protein
MKNAYSRKALNIKITEKVFTTRRRELTQMSGH